jgi:hypothetical protein
MSERGFPGSRVDAKRAGMIATMTKISLGPSCTAHRSRFVRRGSTRLAGGAEDGYDTHVVHGEGNALRHPKLTVAASLALLLVTGLPYLAAAYWPPRGTEFNGTFFYTDDFFQYVSFVEQAMRGAFVFHNKFDVHPHAAGIVNLEWWLGGLLGRLLGGHPIVGFHALRPLIALGLVSGAVRLMRRGGLGGRRLGWALALFLLAGGLGWLRSWQGTVGWQVPDLLMGMYPWHQMLLNHHTALGTALALWTLALYLEWRQGESRRPAWLAAAWALGFTRPYELVGFCVTGVGLAGFDALDPRRRRVAWRRALELGALLPIFAYYFWITRTGTSLVGWSVQGGEVNPPAREFLYAVGPALALIAASLWREPGSWNATEGRDVRLAAALWAGFLALVLLFFHDASLMKTVMTGLGVMVALLAALVTPRRWLPAATAALCPTSLLLLWRAFNPSPDCFSPADYSRATDLLSARCSPQEMALAPTDLSLRIAALTPCSVVLGHRILTPDYPRRVSEGNRFYHEPSPTSWRRLYLDEIGAGFVFLGRGRGGWLRDDPGWEQVLAVPRFEVWQRKTRAPGPAGPDRRE